MSITNYSSNKEREVQDVEDEGVMYELLLDNIHVEMLMDEDDSEIVTWSWDRLQSVEQEDPSLRDEGSWRPGKDQGPQGNSR